MSLSTAKNTGFRHGILRSFISSFFIQKTAYGIQKSSDSGTSTGKCDNGRSSEVFISGRDFLRITSYSEAFRGDLKERSHYYPRMTLLYLDQKCYIPVYENPDDISSKIVDWKPYTPDRHLGFTAFQNEWNSIFFKPSDMPIAFP